MNLLPSQSVNDLVWFNSNNTPNLAAPDSLIGPAKDPDFNPQPSAITKS